MKDGISRHETHDYEFLAIDVRDIDDIVPYQEDHLRHLAHIPKYWSVDDRLREYYRLFVAEPEISGNVVRFMRTFALTITEAAEFENLLANKMKEMQKDAILGGADGSHRRVACRFADGGLREFCEARYEAYLNRDSSPRPSSSFRGAP